MKERRPNRLFPHRWSGALAQGNVFFDRSKGCIGILERIEPAAVHGGHDFRRNDRIYANSPFREVESPFSGQGIHGALGGGISGGSALPGNRDFRSDVDYVPLGLDELVQSKMRKGENMEKVLGASSRESRKGVESNPTPSFVPAL